MFIKRSIAVAVGGGLLTAMLAAPALEPARAWAEDPGGTYTTPGTYSYTVPIGVTVVSVTVAGSQGQSPSGPGGRGGVVSGSIDVWSGQVLTIDVGGYGSGYYPGGAGSGMGGGASDIRGYVIAGGGGGGSSGNSQSDGGTGGYPAGSEGSLSAGNGGKGGTQTAPGAGGVEDGAGAGSSGIGGTGGAGATTAGGGGGGGYFGGGGGAGYRGGGGGSSWVASMVDSPAFDNGGHAGTGAVTITPLAASLIPVREVSGASSASSICQNEPGHMVVKDGTTEGVHTVVYIAEPSASEVDVCFRLEAGGAGLGGMVAITPTVPVVIPSGGGVSPPTFGPPATDENASACSTTTPNAVPGAHPVSSDNVAGFAYTIDAYSNGATTAWVCLQAGGPSPISTRIIVPVQMTPPTASPPAVSVVPGYDVTFYPDPGTP